jgi:two-component system sensor histidine kinase YesM
MVQVINKIIKRSINNVRIKYKFMLFFGIVLFIFIGFTTYFLFTKSYLYIVEKKNETYIQHIEQSKQNIDFTLKSYEKILNTLFLNKSFRESLVQNFESIPEQIDFQRWMYNYLDSLTIDYEPLPMIKIYSGNESLKVDNQMFFLMEDLQSTEWYKITNKRPERIKIHRWLNTIKSRRHEKDFYYICGLVEIFDDYTKRKVAVVTIEIDVEQLFSFLDLAESTIIIVDSEGQVIYSTNRDIITSNISSNEYFSKIKKMKKGSFILSNVENSDMIFFDNIAGTDWKVINIVEERFFLNDTVAIRNFAIILACLCIVISIIITFVYVTIITKRIIILTNAMTEVGKGNFDVSVNISGSDEIGKMSSVFTNMVRKIKELIEKVRITENSLYRLEIMSLQEQIKPHFLYNTLSVICSMAVKIEAHDIYSSILSLSEYYKISLSQGDTIIPIKNEIQHIKAYVNLMKLRFEDRFNANYSIDESVYAYYCPKTILQPIVENSIIHGFCNKLSEIGIIGIKVMKTDEKIIFEISDNGSGIDEERIKEIFSSDSESFALKNIDSKIKLMCGDECGINIKSRIGEGTTTKIELPLIIKDEF